MEKFSLSWGFAILILLCWELEIAASVNVEGRVLLGFKEKFLDPLGAIADWNGKGASDPCSWLGVQCADGSVVSKNAGDKVARKLLQSVGKAERQHHSSNTSQKSSSSPSSFPFSRPSLSPSSSSSAAIPPPISLPPFPSNEVVPASQPSPSPSDFTTPVPSPSPTSETPSLAPILAPHPTISPSPTMSPSSSAGQTNQEKHSISRAAYISIIGGASFLLVLTVFFVSCCRANRVVVSVRPWTTGLSGQLQKAFVTGVPTLKRSEIEIACEDFSNIIESLPDCTLYKGTLSSGVEIAVVSALITCSKDWLKQSESQFRNKISTLSKVNHKNFVNLLGYCEAEEPFTRMMVFEYAPNGTLFEHLHVAEAEHLDWATRLRVAMGIAYCLDHMHQLNPPVIMKNLDSSSIYLTEDYAAKVSDIRFWVESKETLEMPILEPKNNVHAFGLLLIEILSGRIPASGDVLLENWASCYLNGEMPVKEMMDPTLAFFHEEDADALCKVIRSCINPDLRARPTMSEIVSLLKDITSMMPDRAVPMASPLWWAELQILTSEAN